MGTANTARARRIDAVPTLRPTVLRTDDEIRIIPIAGADMPPVDEEWLGAEAMYSLPLEAAAAVDRDLSTSRAWMVHALGLAMDDAP